MKIGNWVWIENWYYFWFEIFKNRSKIFKKRLYKSDSNKSSWNGQFADHFDVFKCLFDKVSFMDLWNWVLDSHFVVSSFLLWADSQFELLVKELFGLFFESVGVEWEEIIDNFGLIGDSEYFFGEFVVSNSPHGASGITDFNTHDKVSNSLINILVTMLTITQTLSNLITMRTPIIMPLLQREPVNKHSQLRPSPFISPQLLSLFLQLSDRGTHFILAFISGWLDLVELFIGVVFVHGLLLELLVVVGLDGDYAWFVDWGESEGVFVLVEFETG